MLDFARNYPLKPVLPVKNFSEKERLASQYALLNYYLGKTMEINAERKQLLTNYCHTLQVFLQIANERKWTYKMLIDDEKKQAITNKWASQSLNVVYLIIGQQLNKSYFENKMDNFVHAWHIFLKLGIVDLGFTWAEIETSYYQG